MTTFGRLTVIQRVEDRGKLAAWLCQCDCGGRVIVTGEALRAGRCRSCGCEQTVEVDMKSIAKEITVTVVVKERGGWRLKIGIWLIRLGCLVSGMGFEED